VGLGGEGKTDKVRGDLQKEFGGGAGSERKRAGGEGNEKFL